MNIIPPVYQGAVTPSAPSRTRLGDVAVPKHLPKKQSELNRERRKGCERRNDKAQPLLELRAGRDRRLTPVSVDTSA